MRVLLIEPDAVLSRLYAEMLSRDGHSVVSTTSAQQAVHLADEQTPDVVIVELQLAAHNGVEFLYEFRSYPEWQHIPVVINTYVPTAELQAFGILSSDLGVRTILYKPATSLDNLRSAVYRLDPARL